jgi:hypothetical protein
MLDRLGERMGEQVAIQLEDGAVAVQSVVL